MNFVETRIFSRQRHEQLPEEQFRALQNLLLENRMQAREFPALAVCGSFAGARKVEASAAERVSSTSLWRERAGAAAPSVSEERAG
jgi:hypothetical protein